MATLTETTHAGGFLLSEGNWSSSRRKGVLLSGQNLIAGAVLGQINKVQAAAPVPTNAGVGTGLMSGLKFGPFVQTGSYVITLTATSATAAFTVTGPDGLALAAGAVGTAYTSPHISFLIANGGTMTTGDTYTVVVTAAGTPIVTGGTGTGTMSAISLGPDAQNGAYQVICRAAVANGGDFEILAPDGSSLGRFLMGTADNGTATFTSSHVNFSLTDATAFIINNTFQIIVATGTGKFAQWAPSTYDGRHIAAGLLYSAADATDGDQSCVVIYKDADVNINELVWPTINDGIKAIGLTQLSHLGIAAR